MAINSDGSVVIGVDMSITKAEKQLQKLTDKIAETEQKLSELYTERDKAEQKGILDSATLDAEKAKLEEMKKQLQEIKTVAKDKTLSPNVREEAKANIPQLQAEISDQKERVRGLQAEWNKTEKSVEKYNDQIQKAEAALEKQKADAGELAESIAEANSISGRFSTAMHETGKSVEKLGTRLKKLASRVLVFSVFTTALRSAREWLGNVVKSNDEASQAVARLKGALLTLIQPLVEVIIPAFTDFVNVLTKVVSSVANIVSILFGTTIEQSAEAAESLDKEQEAINGVGSAAKKASKQLASFDEINKLSAGTASGSSSSISPDFSWIKDENEWGNSALTLILKDLLFKWENLTAEDIIGKVVTGLNAIAGAAAGFSIGGPAGAAIGLAIGTGLGLNLVDSIFNWDGSLDGEEMFKLLLDGLLMIGGTLIGFAAGGPGGAALGLTVGAGLSMLLNKSIFNNDGTLSKEEILSGIVVALGAVAGGILGFSVGGPLGAAVGVAVGAGAATNIAKLLFNNDGEMSKEEIVGSLSTALGAVVGGIIGFAAGGPGGALIGAAIGAGATAFIQGFIFDDEGEVNTDFVGTLSTALGAAVGSVIGFAAGGPGGALIGAALGIGITGLIKGALFKWNGEQTAEDIFNGIKDVLDIAVGGAIGFAIGGPLGGILGMGIMGIFKIFIGNTYFDNAMGSGEESAASKAIKVAVSTILGALVGAAFGGGVFGGVVGGVIGLTFGLSVAFGDVETKGFTSNRANGITASGSIGGSRTSSYALGEELNSIKVPALATGAVIPPNREFMAVLGDQTSGMNIETPENLLRQIVREENGDYTSILREILQAIKDGKIMMVDNNVFAQVVKDANERESNRQGVPLVTMR